MGVDTQQNSIMFFIIVAVSKDLNAHYMSGKEKNKKVAGPAPVKILDGIPVGDLRDALITTITKEVSHCDHFSPCISWPEHKKAKRVNNLWDAMKLRKHLENDAFGKRPNVAVCFDKAYLRIDPVERLGPSISDPDEVSEPHPGVTLNPEAHRVSEELHKCYEEAITAGSDESNANTQTALKVFGRSTRLIGRDSSRPNNERLKRAPSSNQCEIDALKEEVEVEKRKRAKLEGTVVMEKRKRTKLEGTVVMLVVCLQERGMLPPNYHPNASTNDQT